MELDNGGHGGEAAKLVPVETMSLGACTIGTVVLRGSG